MLFNSHSFIFEFLPIVLAVFWTLGSLNLPRAALLWLLLASLAFYVEWRAADLWILLFSILFNYSISSLLVNRRAQGRDVQFFLTAGVAVNLLLLGYFKYSAFFIQNLNAMTGWDWTLQAVALPLGISFYTFQQIAFIVEAARGEFKEPNFLRYSSVVTFFPHLIAGPIINYRSVIGQIRSPDVFRPDAGMIAVGVSVFVIGLAKKVLLADTVAPQADLVFEAAATGADISFLEAWTGALAYSLQLYFDFSGYSDMAIGLALFFGIRLPLNFNSPYKARNIVDFWQRWHMTLSRFLRDYLYIPLGGNRRGHARRYLNLLITMLLGGFWHGAGWTFIIWGALHGMYLVAYHAWDTLRARYYPCREQPSAFGVCMGCALTFLAVVVAWVFFRAASVETALSILGAMSGTRGIEIPEAFAYPTLAPLAEAFGGEFKRQELIQGPSTIAAMLVLLSVALWAPNTQQWVGFSPELGPTVPGATWMHRLSGSPAHAIALGVIFVYALTQMSKVNVFLYFNF